MKTIIVLGTGKTGGEIVRILKDRTDINLICANRSNPPSEAMWQSIDACVCFLPGPAFLDFLDLFLHVPKPMVIGSTGYDLQPEQSERIASLPTTWIMSSNFSIGMSLAKVVLGKMSAWAAGSGIATNQRIEETHHVHKKDAPSGTALLWKRWIELAHPASKSVHDVRSYRVEDECGKHEYTLSLAHETMKFSHDASSRAVFAEGAVWALDQLLDPQSTIAKGRVDFFDLVETSFAQSSATPQKAGPLT